VYASGTGATRGAWWKPSPREAWIRLWRTGPKIDAVFDVLADTGPQRMVCRHEQNAANVAAQTRSPKLHGVLPAVGMIIHHPVR
jgi:hypothetical protein